VTLDYQYSGFTLGNGTDEVVLLDTGSVEVARVNYDGGPNFPDPSGASMYLKGPTLDSSTGANWGQSTVAWTGSAGDYGSPGEANEEGTWGVGVTTMQFAISAQNIAEGSGIVTARVTRTDNTGSATAAIQISGTANNVSDYTFTPTDTNISFGVGISSVDFTVSIVDDSDQEPAETIILDLVDISGATTGSVLQHTITIESNDVLSLMFTASSDTAGEAAGTYDVTVYKSKAVSNLTAEIQLSGSAIEGAENDYTLSTTNVSLSGTTTSQVITVTINDDSDIEGDETVILSLANVTQGQIGSPSVFTLTIDDNESVPVDNIWINEFDYDQGGVDSNEWVELVGEADVSLNDYELILINGSNGEIYRSNDLATASWTFTDESNGYGFFVIGSVAPGEGSADYTPADWGANALQNGNDSIQLRKKLGSANVHLIDYENDVAGTAEDQVTIVTDSDSAQSSVFLSGGTGSAFSDFSWSSTVGVSTPGAVNDGQTLYSVGPTVLVSFAASSATAAEGAGTYVVMVTKSVATNNVTATIQLSGTATEGGGADFTINTTNVVLTGTTTSQTFTVTINDDSEVENTETVILTLGNVAQATLGSPSVFTLTITDNEPVVLANIWINEVDYDRGGTDSDEWIEIAGEAGESLDNYELVLINGADGAIYRSNDLATASWTFTDESDGFGFFVIGSVALGEGNADFTPGDWGTDEIQDGDDAIQIRRKIGSVNVHLVDYVADVATTTEDQVTGVADGTSAKSSVFLSGGPGTNFVDFVWTNTATVSTPGAANDGQSFGSGGGFIDTDHDGMDDNWETANGLTVGIDDSATNTDGDSYTALGEYTLDYSPAVSNAAFLVESIGLNSPPSIGFSVKTTRQYTVQYSTNMLLGSVWSDLNGATDIQPTNQSVTVDLPTDLNNSGYRVEVSVPTQ